MTLRKLSQPARDGLLVAGAAALVSACFLMFVVPRAPLPPPPDYLSYYSPLAHGLMEGKGYRYASGEPCLAYPPGYSLILAGLFYLADATGVAELAAVARRNVLCGLVITALL